MFILAGLLSLTGRLQASTVNDTIVDVKSVKEVVLEDDGETVTLYVKGKEADSTFQFVYTGLRPRIATHVEESKKKGAQQSAGMRVGKKKFCTKAMKWGFGGINLGFANAVGAPGNVNIDMASSVEIAFEPLHYRWYNRRQTQYFSLGLSFGWRNFRMTGHSRFLKDDNGILTTAAYPENASKTEFSRIKLFSLGIPFRYTFKLDKNWKIDLATILNFNTYASVKTRYELTDDSFYPNRTVTHKVKEMTKDLHQIPVSVDFMAQVHWKWLGVYAKYSPCKVLNTDWGPDFTPISVGFSLFY